jgi:putative radical SAM enzyme (TIGR03279 family)
MSEIPLKPVNALIVASVEPGSAAYKAGIVSGDMVRTINGRKILDILDYRFHSAASRLSLELLRGDETITVTMRKRLDEDAGMDFEYDLGDKIHTCKNKCVFCFIHQQPKKMRKSLYLMDDDFRLSFMHGNYVTLTNLSDEEWARILEQRLSPLYVSVHATDPELRGKLLGRKDPTPIIPQIRELADNRIDVHAQIVLCPGWNDGDALNRTLDDLAAENRAISGKRAGVPSVAIVPVGMTRFRERLPSISHVERDYARDMIAFVRKKEREFQKSIGSRFAWLADEWYHIADVPYPGREHYEDFPQLEDGIGTVRLFKESARSVHRRLPKAVDTPLKATLVTAEMPARVVQEFADRLNQIDGVDVNVCVVKNSFFGGDIHIAGLLTAQDIIDQVRSFPGCHHTVYLPKICLREDGLFLDDMTLTEVAAALNKKVVTVGNSPRELAGAMGLVHISGAGTGSSNRWLMEPEAAVLQQS